MQVAIIYPNLDLSMLDLLKVVKDDQVVDEEGKLDQDEVVSPKEENAPSSRSTSVNDEGRAQEEGEAIMFTPPNL